MLIQLLLELNLKKHIWIQKNKKCDTIEITLRDENKRKLETWIVNIRDKKRMRQIVATLKASYGLILSSPTDNSDLDWLQ